MVALHTRHPLPRPINGVYQRDGRARDVGERPAPQPRQGWISGGSHFQFVTAIAQSDRLAFPTVGGFGRAFYGTDLCSGPCATPQPQAEVSVIFRVFRPSHVQMHASDLKDKRQSIRLIRVLGLDVPNSAASCVPLISNRVGRPAESVVER
jgi:hypothetical protein